MIWSSIFQFVKKTGANIGSKLSVLKSLALGNKIGNTVPCFGHGNCKCCLMIDEPNVQGVNDITARPASGNCKTKVSCRLSCKSYISRTVQPLADQMSRHRVCTIRCCGNIAMWIHFQMIILWGYTPHMILVVLIKEISIVYTVCKFWKTAAPVFTVN